MRSPSMEKVLPVGKKYSALVLARTPTTWVMQWRMDCRAVVQVKSNLLPGVLCSPIHHCVGGVGGADMKIGKQIERRARRRFGLALTVRFRMTRKGSTSHWGTGAIHNVSSSGISFQCRGPLPVKHRMARGILMVMVLCVKENKFRISDGKGRDGAQAK